MSDLHKVEHHGKISPAFSARLVRLKPKQKVHAVILLRTQESAERAPGRPTTPDKRQAATNEIGASTTRALRDIDAILSRFEGRRLSDKPTVLGTLAIESTPAGISALTDSDHIKAILENQPISQV